MGNASTSEHSRPLQKLYQDKQYELFIEQLLNAKGSFSDGTYHYNLGTAYLKTGDVAASRYHLEKALQKGLLTPGVYKNLDTAISRLEVANMEGGRYFTDNAVSQILRMPHELFLTLGLVFVLALTTLLRLSKIKKTVYIIGLVVSLCPFLLLLLIQQNYQRAILLEQAFSYEGPSRSFEASSEIPAGASVVVRRDNESWLYITAPTHFSGWVDRNKLGIL